MWLGDEQTAARKRYANLAFARSVGARPVGLACRGYVGEGRTAALPPQPPPIQHYNMLRSLIWAAAAASGRRAATAGQATGYGIRQRPR